MTTEATDINTDPGFSRAMEPDMAPASVSSGKSPWYWVVACATQTCISPLGTGPLGTNVVQGGWSDLGKHIASVPTGATDIYSTLFAVDLPMHATQTIMVPDVTMPWVASRPPTSAFFLSPSLLPFCLFPQHISIQFLFSHFFCDIFVPHNGTHLLGAVRCWDPG